MEQGFSDLIPKYDKSEFFTKTLDIAVLLFSVISEKTELSGPSIFQNFNSLVVVLSFLWS